MTAPLSEEYLAEVEARAAAASEGPWWVDNDSPDLCRWVAGKSPIVEINFGYRGNSNLPDAQFTAHAREDVPALADEIRRLWAIVAAAETAAETTEPPTPHARLAKVRLRPTHAGGWRVRYRLNGKRRSSCAFPTQELAQGRVDSLRAQFGEEL